MNARSGNLLTDKLVPYLDSLPAQASSFAAQLKGMIDTNPQGLLQSLFSPDAVKQIPAAFSSHIVPILKTSLMDSLHSVFYTGLIFIAVGAVFTLFLKPIKLSNKKAEDQQEKEKAAKAVESPSH